MRKWSHEKKILITKYLIKLKQINSDNKANY
jgi:hypothetical protein